MEYANWKKVVWRFGRIFIGAFIVNFSSFMIMVDGAEIIKDGFAVSFGMFVKSLWLLFIYPGILSGIIAGIAAIGKFIRDKWGNKDKTGAVNKIII